MKNNISKLIPVMISLAALFLTFDCQKDPVSTEDIRTDLPEIKEISSDNLLPLPGDTIEVSVEAIGGASFSWTASSGTFSDASANPTRWYAPQDASGPQRLTCEVSNSAGSRKASITVTVSKVTAPEGASGYWPLDTDFKDYNAEGVGPNDGSGDDLVSIDTEEFIRGAGSALFEGEDGADNGQFLAGGEGLDMGTDAEYSISLWVKTEDEFGFLVGKTIDGEYVDEGSKCLYLAEGLLIGDLWGVTDYGWDEELFVSDGEWHHIVWIKRAFDEGEGGVWIEIWFDGEFAWEVLLEEWLDDVDGMFTLGGSWEAPGEDWPGAIQGNIDDVAFYPYALEEDDIIAIFEGE